MDGFRLFTNGAEKEFCLEQELVFVESSHLNLRVY